jgi:hypothetical protein
VSNLFEIVIAAGSLVCAVCSVACAIWVANRDGKWRDTEEAKAIIARIDGAEDRLSRLETKMADLATKGDVNTLRAEFHGLENVIKSEVSATRGAIDDMKEGVGEIRRWIMQEGKS